MKNVKQSILNIIHSKRALKALAFSAVGIIFVIVCLVASGVTVGYTVNYDGQVIATVGSKRLFTKAVNLAVSEVGGDVESKISKPDYSAVLTLKNKLSDENTVKDAILENTDSIVYASLLRVNGKETAYVLGDDLADYLNDYCASFNIKAKSSTSEFVDDVEVEIGYFATDSAVTLDEAKQIVKGLSVKTEAVVAKDTKIAYSNTVKRTSSQMLGYSKVTTAGKAGIRRTTDRVVYLNGAEVERENLSSQVVSNPVNQVTVVGTAKSLASASQRKAAYASGFIFPLPKNANWKVSSYWGDGRGHKGVDICAPYGTNIYAVAEGTVSYSGYSGDYGYMVIIDHGNGISTAYAHCSTLGVKKGEKVSTGETIALVGSTGYSTGNHVHFEVRKNGNRIDPAPYIGLD